MVRGLKTKGHLEDFVLFFLSRCFVLQWCLLMLRCFSQQQKTYTCNFSLDRLISFIFF
jgi:hypothetical protein